MAATKMKVITKGIYSNGISAIEVQATKKSMTPKEFFDSLTSLRPKSNSNAQCHPTASKITRK